MSQQNIHYQLTKQRTDQSMYSKGALASYKRLDQFLRKHGNGLRYKKPAVQYFVWVRGEEAVAEAMSLEKKLFADFGEPLTKSSGYDLVRTESYDKIFEWRFDGDIEQYLEYIDALGKLPNLRPRPPVYVIVSAEFWLHGVEESETMMSEVTAWLSPTSNKAAFLFNFPHATTDDEFAKYRESIQAYCPVKLEDKYFYIRKHPAHSGRLLK